MLTKCKPGRVDALDVRSTFCMASYFSSVCYGEAQALRINNSLSAQQSTWCTVFFILHRNYRIDKWKSLAQYLHNKIVVNNVAHAPITKVFATDETQLVSMERTKFVNKKNNRADLTSESDLVRHYRDVILYWIYHHLSDDVELLLWRYLSLKQTNAIPVLWSML